MLHRPFPPHPPGRLRLTRRAGVVTLAGVATVATGCTDERPRETPDGVVTPTAPPDDEDDELVGTVLDQLADARDDVAELGRRAPGVREQSRALVSLHEAHGRELGGLRDPRRRAPGGRSLSEDAARGRIDAVETGLAADLADAAVAAGSGALAQLFASMSAALAQRRLS